MDIGTIVSGQSHIFYTCQIYGAQDTAQPPTAYDYAFGRFVQICIPSAASCQQERGKQQLRVVGIVYNTLSLNPSFGTAGPRLSHAGQVEILTPDYPIEQKKLVNIAMIGMGSVREGGPGEEMEVWEQITQGIPPLSVPPQALVQTMSDQAIRAFHTLPCPPYVQVSYLAPTFTRGTGLLPLVAQRVFQQLEQLFPERQDLIALANAGLSWRLKLASMR